MWYIKKFIFKNKENILDLEQISYEYERYGRFKTHIPSHHVYYIRAALKERTGKDFSVEEIEKALVAEGISQYV